MSKSLITANQLHTNASRIQREERKAKAAGLSIIQYRILAALVKAGPEGFTYREIEKRTGYYTILTRHLRKRSSGSRQHNGSLGSRGLVTEVVKEDAHGRQFLAFAITQRGLALIVKAHESLISTRRDPD